jgi:dienelactone hydrolase
MTTLKKLKQTLGPMPAQAPLNAEVVGRVMKDGFEEIKVEYDVEAGERISAYLLIPENTKQNAPAVFCHHQHAGNFELGKSEVVGHKGDPDQAIGPELARLGYVVLAPDAIAFEDRNWSLPTGRAEYLEMAFRTVKGETLLAKAIHDISVGISYLESLKEVDASRIGFFGHSYGGRMAIWAPALDKRIKASVSNCGCINYKDSLDRDVGIQAEFCVPNILGFGDVEDVVRLVSPNALYISATTDDVYSRGAQDIYKYAKDDFPVGQLQFQLWGGGHVFTQEMRQAAYQFLADKL